MCSFAVGAFFFPEHLLNILSSTRDSAPPVSPRTTHQIPGDTANLWEELKNWRDVSQEE